MPPLRKFPPIGLGILDEQDQFRTGAFAVEKFKSLFVGLEAMQALYPSESFLQNASRHISFLIKSHKNLNTEYFAELLLSTIAKYQGSIVEMVSLIDQYFSQNFPRFLEDIPKEMHRNFLIKSFNFLNQEFIKLQEKGLNVALDPSVAFRNLTEGDSDLKSQQFRSHNNLTYFTYNLFYSMHYRSKLYDKLYSFKVSDIVTQVLGRFAFALPYVFERRICGGEVSLAPSGFKEFVDDMMSSVNVYQKSTNAALDNCDDRTVERQGAYGGEVREFMVQDSTDGSSGLPKVPHFAVANESARNQDTEPYFSDQSSIVEESGVDEYSSEEEGGVVYARAAIQDGREESSSRKRGYDLAGDNASDNCRHKKLRANNAVAAKASAVKVDAMDTGKNI